ncbi:MAG: ABC transporter permease [bacterium]|nr:ABC transporter permease [bacterium]
MTAPSLLAPAPARHSRSLNLVAVVTGAILIAVVVLAVFGPWFAPHPAGQTIGRPLANTGADGWLGTDRLGRDVWSQILHGGRRTVIIPLVATLAATVAGDTVGLLAGRRPRNRILDAVLMVIIAMPAMLILLLLLHRFGKSAWVPIAAVVVVAFPYSVRYARSASAKAWGSSFVEQARLRGESNGWILRHEVLPNVAGPVLSDTGLRFATSVQLVTAASFLGFGPSAPATDWATQISKNLDGASLNLWAIAAPALMIALLTVPANLLADRLAARIEQ